MNRKSKSILIILLVVLMLVLITGVAVAGRPKNGNQNFLYTCGDWPALQPFLMQGHKIGNGMCPALY
jgi:hypothetical protein